MLHTTRGIVFRFLKYRETSIITKIFTRELGNQTYVIPGVRTKRAKHNIALFQPLTRLEMVVYYKAQRSLQRLAEAACYTPNSTMLLDAKKATITIFLAELLTQVIQEEEKNEPLFDFLWQAVARLNKQTTHYEFFYLTFMLQLSHYLGFGVNVSQDIHIPMGHGGPNSNIEAAVHEGIDALLRGEGHNYEKIDSKVRTHVIDAVVKFYQLHIDSLHTLKSLKLLHATA